MYKIRRLGVFNCGATPLNGLIMAEAEWNIGSGSRHSVSLRVVQDYIPRRERVIAKAGLIFAGARFAIYACGGLNVHHDLHGLREYAGGADGDV